MPRFRAICPRVYAPAAVDTPLIERLRELQAGDRLHFNFDQIRLADVLLGLHTNRFTGALMVGAPPQADRLFFREGSAVGFVVRPDNDLTLFAQVLVALKFLSAETVSAALEEPAEDSLALAERLVEMGLLTEDARSRAFEEQALRRLFQLYDAADAPVEVRGGLESLAHFFAVYIDVRPAIAYGMVVRAAPEAQQEILHKVDGKNVRLIAPYDTSRNSYGLPPPVLGALADLSRGVHFVGDMHLPGLSARETAGVLLLFDRMAMLEVS